MTLVISGGAATVIYWLFELPSIRRSRAVSRSSSSRSDLGAAAITLALEPGLPLLSDAKRPDVIPTASV
jgi:peptidoglycan/LPS O-acetylase OafA/YrhL